MADKTTPMMQQYRRIRGELPPDVILFFRLGDFYEMFFDDAARAAPLLDIALTKRNGVPMCGVPFHSVENYLAKLVGAGKRVAICDQVEEAGAGPGIVKREVSRIVTSGTAMESGLLESKRNNFLAGVFKEDDSYGLALLDLSTGQFICQELTAAEHALGEIQRFGPSECVISEDQAQDSGIKSVTDRLAGERVSTTDDWPFRYEAAYDLLTRHFGVAELEGFGCEGKKALVGAAGGVLHYVAEELRCDITHVNNLRVADASDFLVLDPTTCKNLDLISSPGRQEEVSLLKVLDRTSTAMGGRMLRDWILRPLVDPPRICERLDAVDSLHSNRLALRDIKDKLGEMRDIERLISRIGGGSGNARDLRALGQSLALIPELVDLASVFESKLLKRFVSETAAFPDLVGLIKRSIADEPPVALKEGGIIRDGYSAELDELRKVAGKGRQWLADYQVSEQQATGIKNLKVRHNKVFGYYIEVSKGQLDNVPDHYSRKQTLVNAERFITPELKEYEIKVVGAQEKAYALEYELFNEVKKAAAEETRGIQDAAEAVAALDALCAFASRALESGYNRPKVHSGDSLIIRQGRHPVIEHMPGSERFVPNDTLLDCDENQLLIITGPNMAGKSTYIRQTALIVIMAQAGSFVPADSAEIGVVDRVFTRVGASDNLALGRSTFMVEMQETANILNNATTRSLIVLDEIGRGTSTFDGISIAWAVAEYLHDNASVKARTLFATHFHELTDLERTMKGVRNYNILVREKNDKVAFLRKIVPGGADQSYGIQVARLAGLPAEVIARAKEILSNLEEGELGETGQPRLARRGKGGSGSNQMSLFD